MASEVESDRELQEELRSAWDEVVGGREGFDAVDAIQATIAAKFIAEAMPDVVKDALLDALLRERGAFRAHIQVGLHHDPDSEYDVDWSVRGVPDEHRSKFTSPSSIYGVVILPLERVPVQGEGE